MSLRVFCSHGSKKVTVRGLVKPLPYEQGDQP